MVVIPRYDHHIAIELPATLRSPHRVMLWHRHLELNALSPSTLSAHFQESEQSTDDLLSQPNDLQQSLGIVASRLVETEGRPSIVLTPGNEPTMLTGSMRSVPGVDAKALLDAVNARLPGALSRYGGHTAV